MDRRDFLEGKIIVWVLLRQVLIQKSNFLWDAIAIR